MVSATLAVWLKYDSTVRFSISAGPSVSFGNGLMSANSRHSSRSRANNLRPDDLTLLQLVAPFLFVIGGIYILAPILPMRRSWARDLLFATVWLIVGRYIGWRVFTTVLPARGAWYEVGWVWFCFAVEILALFDAFLLYLTFLRTSDRHAEAEGHEARLRALPAKQLPLVDVYIPTYNEPFDVLEKTITGALCLDYPNAHGGSN
jgi:cellulose synthase (UDP-forming)